MWANSHHEQVGLRKCCERLDQHVDPLVVAESSDKQE